MYRCMYYSIRYAFYCGRPTIVDMQYAIFCSTHSQFHIIFITVLLYVQKKSVQILYRLFTVLSRKK